MFRNKNGYFLNSDIAIDILSTKLYSNWLVSFGNIWLINNEDQSLSSPPLKK